MAKRHNKEQALTRTQRDMLRSRLRYLMASEASLVLETPVAVQTKEKKIVDQETLIILPVHIQKAIREAQLALVKGIQRLLADFKENAMRAENKRVENYWKQQLEHYQTQVALSASERKKIGEQALEVIEEGLETSSIMIETVKTIPEVLSKGFFVVGGALAAIGDSFKAFSESFDTWALGISFCLQGIFLIKDLFSLIFDRCNNPDKTVMAKLIEGGRWRRLLKISVRVTLTIIGLLFDFGLVPMAMITMGGIFFSGTVEVAHLVYERAKMKKLDKKLLSEYVENQKALMDAVNQKVTEGKLTKDQAILEKIETADRSLIKRCDLSGLLGTYLLAKKMHQCSMKKLHSKNRGIALSVVSSFLAVTSGALLTLGAESLPCIVAGGILFLAFISLEIYLARKKIKQLPGHVKNMITSCFQKPDKPEPNREVIKELTLAKATC